MIGRRPARSRGQELLAPPTDFATPSLALHEAVELDDRQQHRQHDQHHHAAHADDQQRLEDRGHLHARGAALRLPSCSAARSSIMRQLAGLLAEAREHRQDAGEALLAGQRRGERRAFAHLHQRVHRVGAHGAVGQRLGRGLQRLQDRHAGAGQHRQRAGEARRVVAAREPPTSGRPSKPASKRSRNGLVAQRASAAPSRRPRSSSTSQP